MSQRKANIPDPLHMNPETPVFSAWFDSGPTGSEVQISIFFCCQPWNITVSTITCDQIKIIWRGCHRRNDIKLFPHDGTEIFLLNKTVNVQISVIDISAGGWGVGGVQIRSVCLFSALLISIRSSEQIWPFNKIWFVNFNVLSRFNRDQMRILRLPHPSLHHCPPRLIEWLRIVTPTL